MVVFRIAEEMTQKELSEKIGINQSSISHFKKAMKMPSILFLTQITNTLGLDWEFHIHPKSV
jgi:transcriptional regulator with XRE-family HTH domain